MASNYMDLLQSEHAKLQQNYAELQKRYDILVAATGSNNSIDDNPVKLSFVQKLVAKIAEIYDKDLFSDITIHCDGHQLRGHRLVISTRTDYWDDLSGIDRIEFEGIPYNVGCAVLKWMYTDHVDNQLGNRYLMDIFAAAAKFRLLDLQKRCESLLLGRIDEENCLVLYEFAIKNDLIQLKEECGKVVKGRWNYFDIADFANMSASLLFRLVERLLNPRFVKLSKLCNEEMSGTYPLELAIELGQMEMATSLISHHADVNVYDRNGKTLLMRLLEKNQIDGLKFLAQHGANILHKTMKTNENLLHIAAASVKCSDELLEWLSSNLHYFDINDMDNELKTPFMRAVESENTGIIELFLQNGTGIDVNKSDRNGRSPIACALFEIKNLPLAEMIVKAGADINIRYKDTFLIHYAVGTENLDAVQFLCRNKVDVNKRTAEGLVPLQIVIDSKNYNADLFRILLRAGARISEKVCNSLDTLLHHIIDKENSSEILDILAENGNCNGDVFATVDWKGNTPFAKAVLAGKFETAEGLIRAGVDVNEKNFEGISLLMRVIDAKLDDAAVFLLDHSVDISGSISGKDCFSLAVEYSLLKTVRRLCDFTAGREKQTETSLLWTALKKGSFEVAKTLVDSGCNPNGWCYDDGDNDDNDRKCRQTLLHKAIGLKMRDAAIFLIDHGCDLDAIEQNDGQQSNRDTPLLASIRSGFDDVALRLIGRGARLDKQDAKGRTAIHLAVQMQNNTILDELLSNCNPGFLADTDHDGLTPLNLAISTRNYVAAEALVKKAPNLVTQIDKDGEMLLHKAVREADLEWVLFLIGANSDVNACTQNAEHFTALHLSAQCGSEIIMRNLILAGANVNATAADGRTSLHVAASCNHEALCMILMENGAQPNVSDQFGNTPLHAAVSHGSVASVNVLVADPRINLRAVNKKQQNPLFLAAGDLSRTNSLDILQMFLNADPQFPLDAKDADGFTVFLLAYLKGNENMCRALLRCGVCLGVISHAGISVFKHTTPTKQLLFSLLGRVLDKLEREPCWAEGDFCSECEMKFSLTMRKHHCRHCGRLVCARCSEQTIPILKYGIEKPVRVCQICCDILTMGHA